MGHAMSGAQESPLRKQFHVDYICLGQRSFIVVACRNSYTIYILCQFVFINAYVKKGFKTEDDGWGASRYLPLYPFGICLFSIV